MREKKHGEKKGLLFCFHTPTVPHKKAGKCRYIVIAGKRIRLNKGSGSNDSARVANQVVFHRSVNFVLADFSGYRILSYRV